MSAPNFTNIGANIGANNAHNANAGAHNANIAQSANASTQNAQNSQNANSAPATPAAKTAKLRALLARLPARLQTQLHRALTAHSPLADCLIALLFAAILCSLYFEVADIRVWRHDSALMYNEASHYIGKLREEGRWLNYAVFELLRRIHPQVSSILCLLCWGYFCWVVAARCTDCWRLRLIFTLFAAQLFANSAIIGWPSISLPSYAVLALCALLSRRAGYPLVLAVGGVLFFGGFNNFYNLLPLLYVREISRGGVGGLARFFAWWVGCFVAGWALMQLLTIIIGGAPIKIASWRGPRPIHSLGDFVANVERVWGSLKSNIKLINRDFVLYALGFFALFALFDWVKGRRKGGVLALVVLVAVALSGYAQSIPYGLGVVARTAVFLYAAAFVLVFLLCLRARNLGLVFMVIIAFGTYFKNYDSLHFYAAATNAWRGSVAAIHATPAATRVIHVCSTDKQIAASERMIARNLRLRNYHQEGFGQFMRQNPIFKSLGFEHWDNNAKACAPHATAPRNETALYSYIYVNNELFLWYK